MKPFLTIVAFIMLPAMGMPQSSALIFKDAGLRFIIPAAELTLTEAGNEAREFNMEEGTLKSDYFIFKNAGVKNRAKYIYTLVDSILTIRLTELQLASGNSWARADDEPASQLSDSLLGNQANRIRAIIADKALLEKAVAASKYFLKFNPTVSNGGMKISIESARRMGDWIIISGKMRSEQECSTNASIVAQDYKGEGLWVQRVDIGGITDNISVGCYHDYKAGEEKDFNLYFSLKDKSLNAVYSLTINWGVGNRGIGIFDMKAFKFYDVAIPFNPDPSLDASTFEVYKNVFFTWENAVKKADSLKLYFSLANKTNKEVRLDITHFWNMQDTAGNDNNNIELFINNKASSYEKPVMPAGAVFKGFFRIITPVDLKGLGRFAFATEMSRFEFEKPVFKKIIK